MIKKKMSLFVARSKVNDYIKLDPRFGRLRDQPIRFLEVGNSANQMISRSGSRLIRCFCLLTSVQPEDEGNSFVSF